MNKFKEVKEFTIDRSKWHTGEATKKMNSHLYVPETKRMCCLGFYGACLGRTRKSMSEKNFLHAYKVDAVHGVEDYRDIFRFGVLDFDSQMALAKINDDERKNLPKKEKGIKAIFADKGVKVKFVGKLLP